MKLWIKNTDGKPDAMLTFAVLAFAFILIKLLLSGASFVIGDATYSLGELDASTVAATLTPTLGAYIGRRHTDRKYALQQQADEEEEMSDDEVLEIIREDARG